MSTNFDSVTKFLGGDNSEGSPAQVFIEMLKLPDEQFDQFYPVLMERLDDVFSSNSMQKQVIDNLNSNPNINLKEESQALDEIVKEIDETWEVSDNKKNMVKTFLNKSRDLTVSLSENPRERIEVKVHRISEDAILPKYAHDTDAGADIYSISDVTINPNETVIVPTGLTVAIPAGYEIQIRPRSGLSLKTNLRIANAPATIDAAYRGEVGVIMNNIGDKPVLVKKGDRIAQMLIAPTPMILWKEVNELDTTDRGAGGFGSTGTS